ncbi:TPA: hypothetical protein SMN85_003648 [Pseudomonas aeruginosa]|nr:hypothetical protein [Pseudomonas aeruginosa]HEK0003316.1 hypothetical protein [Pseudomonas aeruginosa]HEK0035451.1 hypothetical protein [Pseudomonas aeruginosa]
MSNCSHEAWDFGALQCPDCGAVKGHVADADYAKLEAEAQALREEVAALRARVVVPREFLERIRSQLDLRAEFDQTYPPETQPVNDDARLFLELRALLSEQE